MRDKRPSLLLAQLTNLDRQEAGFFFRAKFRDLLGFLDRREIRSRPGFQTYTAPKNS